MKSNVTKLESSIIDSGKSLVAKGIWASVCWNPYSNYSAGKKFICRVLYAITPFVLLFVWGCIVGASGVYSRQRGFYSFFDDFTNCFAMWFLLFFFYYSSGIFLFHFNHKLIDGSKWAKKVMPKSYKNILVLCHNVSTIASWFFSLFALFFILQAKKIGGKLHWYSKLSYVEYIYYCVLIIIIFYSSARLIIQILTNAVFISLAVSKKESLGVSDRQRKELCNYGRELFNLLTTSIGIGVSIFIAIIVVVISDARAQQKFSIPFVLFTGRKAIISIVFFFSLLFFGTMILCLVSVKEFISRNISCDTVKTSTPNRAERLNFRSVIPWKGMVIVLITSIAALLQVFSSPEMAAFLAEIILYR